VIPANHSRHVRDSLTKTPEVSRFREAALAEKLEPVPSYLIESYLPRNPAAFANALAGARRAAELADDVVYLRTTYLPSDEICLHLFQAPSSDALGEAARHAALAYLRIVEAIEQAAHPAATRSR
jgi:hypothetical protein